jgi:hypothetical protein
MKSIKLNKHVLEWTRKINKMNESCSNGTKPRTFKAMLRSWYFWKPVSAVLIGAVAGFLYYNFIGCSTGSCAITSNPYSSILIGGMMGLFIVNSPCKTC